MPLINMLIPSPLFVPLCHYCPSRVSLRTFADTLCPDRYMSLRLPMSHLVLLLLFSLRHPPIAITKSRIPIMPISAKAIHCNLSSVLIPSPHFFTLTFVLKTACRSDMISHTPIASFQENAIPNAQQIPLTIRAEIRKSTPNNTTNKRIIPAIYFIPHRLSS